MSEVASRFAGSAPLAALACLWHGWAMGRVAVAVVFMLAVVSCSETGSSVSSTGPSSTSVVASTRTTVGPTTTSTAPATTSSSAAVSFPEPVEGWVRLETDPGVFGAVTVADGAVGDGRLVLVGCEGSDSDVAGFPVWWSDDATGWQRADGPSDMTCLTQVEASSFGFFATGGPHGVQDQFHSLDGVTWERLDLSDDFGFDYPDQLGVGFAIFVAPNEDRVTLLYSRAAEAESRIATLVTTTDGETWELGSPDSAALYDSSSVAAVIEGGPGLIAVGSSPGGEFVPSAAAFVSSDGLNWTRVTPRNSDFDNKIMTDVMPFAGGYVAVGGDFFDTGLMTAWTSPDGRTWSRSPYPSEETDPSVAQMTAETVTAAAGSIWAAGRDFDARRDSDDGLPAMWNSPDGVTWTRVDFDEARGTIPFLVIDIPDRRIGVWPPPFSLTPDPVQIFEDE